MRALPKEVLQRIARERKKRPPKTRQEALETRLRKLERERRVY